MGPIRRTCAAPLIVAALAGGVAACDGGEAERAVEREVQGVKETGRDAAKEVERSVEDAAKDAQREVDEARDGLGY